MYAAGTVFALGATLGYRGRRMAVRMLWRAIVDTGKSALDILMIAAAAGFIIGILRSPASISRHHLPDSSRRRQRGAAGARGGDLHRARHGHADARRLRAAGRAGGAGAGRGRHHAARRAHVHPLSRHDVDRRRRRWRSPPFRRRAIAKADPMRTGFAGVRFGWTAYIVPFLFVFSPSLLLQSKSVIGTAVAIATAIAGIWLVSAGMVGFITRPLSLALRAGLLIGGLALLVPHEIAPWAFWANVAAAPLAVLLAAGEIVAARRARAAIAAGPA
jgi:hypothetical protein